MERTKYILKTPLVILPVIFGVGVIGHLYTPTREFMKNMTPLILLFVTLYILILDGSKKTTIIMVFLFLFTFTCELIGVKTGYIFGQYNYGATLGLKLFEVPLIIGINWVMVILGCYELTKKKVNHKLLQILCAAGMAVIFDYVLEPVAINLGYWSWDKIEIPWTNYFSWFVISAISISAIQKMHIQTSGKFFGLYLIVQFIFFSLLNLFLK